MGKPLRFRAIEDAKKSARKDLQMLSAICSKHGPEWHSHPWRSVIEDGDPKGSNRYLCTFVQGDMKWVGIASWDGRYWKQNGNRICNGSGDEPCYVSHWMPVDPVSKAHSWQELHQRLFCKDARSSTAGDKK